MAAQINTMITSLIGLVMFCLFTAEMYHYYGHHIKLVISRRSLGKGKKLTHLEVKFPKNYHATGRLFLPHSKIVEPFEIWFTSELNRSRIDYYYGTDKTYQRADLGEYGVTFKVVPMYTEKDGNYIGCWKLEGHKGWPIIPQPIVPNMTYFTYAGEEVYMGTPVTKWEYRYLVFDMLNTHTLLVSKIGPVHPVRYEMKGYDSLMASYYDSYVLEYISFEEWKPDLDKFELPKDQWCYNWSHSLDSHFVSNPMGEFMSYGEDLVDEMYHIYNQNHGKVHDSKHEHVKRKHIFRHNMRYIRSINRQNLTYKLAPNHLVDLTDEEYDGHGGANEDNSTEHKGSVHLEEHEAHSNMMSAPKAIEIPDELDWRDFGAVTPVRGQGICGSCYALGAVGTVEGAYFLKTGRLVELSAQQIVDCSWGSGNHGCRGGWYNKALSWIYLHGVAKAKNYGPYLAQEGTCETIGLKERIKIDAFAFVPKYNNSALKRAIAKYGPVCVSINQKPLSLKFYSWGVYDNPECDNSSTLHTVLVVGYGKENGVPYWLVKNSWSATWGIDGYIKMAWKGNICGVTKNPVVALMNHTTFQFPVKEKINNAYPLNPKFMGRKIHAQHRPGKNRNGSKSESISSGDKNSKGRVTSISTKDYLGHSDGKNGEKSFGVKESTRTLNRNKSNKVIVNKDKKGKVEMNQKIYSRKEELATKSVDESTGKTSNMDIPPPTSKTFDFYLKRDGNNADRTPQLTKSPEILANDFYEGYNVYRSENFSPYGNRDSAYKYPEENNAWTQTRTYTEPRYFIPSYDYTAYDSYPVELAAPYDKNYELRSDKDPWYPSDRNQWYLSNNAAPGIDTQNNKIQNDLETLPSQMVAKTHEPVNAKDHGMIRTEAQSTDSTRTTKVTATTATKRTKQLNSRPRPAKPPRHYTGKLQEIYENLERVIASSLKKNTRLRG